MPHCRSATQETLLQDISWQRAWCGIEIKYEIKTVIKITKQILNNIVETFFKSFHLHASYFLLYYFIASEMLVILTSFLG
jgi:hypothetical protein